MRIRGVRGGAWDAVGRPLDQGARLRPVVGNNQFWFAWSIFHHGSAVFGRSEPVRTATIATGEGCGVPCEEIVMGCPGPDCIPALTRPKQVDAASPDASYLEERSFVVGVEVGDDVRAYPHNILWWHEIVNDVVGGRALAITHCPLTFSSIVLDARGFGPNRVAELGVSGRLFDSNLVYYDREDGSWFSQLLGRSIKGPALGAPAPQVHAFEMTWAAWRALHPTSTVLSSDTGHGGSYARYPYGPYFTDDRDTFGATNPAPDAAYSAKALTYGVTLGTTASAPAKAYVHEELARWARRTYGDDARRGVLNDVVGQAKLAIVFDVDAAYVQAFDRTGEDDVELAP